jgi:hypothetical protein
MAEANIFSPEPGAATTGNFALETGGNLAALVQLTQQMERLLEFMPLLIARLDAINLTQANASGSFVNPDDLILVQ